MENSGHNLLLRFIDSAHFSLFVCISYLARYADNVGIHHYLCKKLRTFPYLDIEFFLPQLCQIVLTVPTESVALEEFLLDMCNRSTHSAVCTFWLLQAHLEDLSHDPEARSFQICRRVYNRVQYVLFGVGDPPTTKITANAGPALMLASAVMGVTAVPKVTEFMGPITIAQARRPRLRVFRLRRDKSQVTQIETDNVRHNVETDEEEENEPERGISTIYGLDPSISGISSLPDLRTRPAPSPSMSSPSVSTAVSSVYTKLKRTVHRVAPLTPSAKVRLLKTNYFRYETSFAYALQAISTRLRLVPKPARLSALRAEITLLNNELPAEVDIPMILEADTYRSTPRQHQIVRIAPNEATILNSAERVPFLLMVEVLRDEICFDPDTPRNKEIINNPTDYRSLFDLPYASPHLHLEIKPTVESTQAHLLMESEMGDISASPLLELDMDNLPVLSAESSKSSSPRTSDLSFAKKKDEDNEIAVHMRTAATMLAQLDLTQGMTGGLKLPKDEIQQIKARIISSMQQQDDVPETIPIRRDSTTELRAVKNDIGVGERRMENDLKTGVIQMVGLESNIKTGAIQMVGFGEEWQAKKERIRKSSPFGHLPTWDLVSVIAKTGSDLRQEAFACQLIHAIKRIWEEAEVNVWVRRMTILVTGAGSGLVETITNGVSIHSLKKALATSILGPSESPHKKVATLSEYFFRVFGNRGSQPFKHAQEEFIKSLAAYSLICYILQIKDRHNGNILLDTEGHVIHIDFGFLLSNSPGSVGFEAAPFKLTQEYIDLMDGSSSEAFESFRALLKVAFKALRKKADDIVILVEMMQKESPLPCFMSGEATASLLRQRFMLQLSEPEVDAFVDNQLIAKSMGSVYTRLYDQYQLVTQGIYS